MINNVERLRKPIEFGRETGNFGWLRVHSHGERDDSKRRAPTQSSKEVMFLGAADRCRFR